MSKTRYCEFCNWEMCPNSDRCSNTTSQCKYRGKGKTRQEQLNSRYEEDNHYGERTVTPCEASLIPLSTGEKVFIALAFLFFLAFAIYDSTTPPRV